MSQDSRRGPIARFSTRLEWGDYLNFSVWAGRKDPNAEIIRVDIRRLEDDIWSTVGRLAVYRTPEGEFVKLPD